MNDDSNNNKFEFTKTIIRDIEDANLDEGSPINDYLVNILIITFSSEMECYLKEFFRML